MRYKKGMDVLPPELLREVQKYIEGELIYIPKKEKRAGWGEISGSKMLIESRNEDIYGMYKEGVTIEDLSDRYHLSTDSIRKIVYKSYNRR